MIAIFILALIAEIVLALIAICVESSPLYWAIGYAVPVTVMAYMVLRLLIY